MFFQAPNKGKRSSDAVESSLSKMTETLSAFMNRKADNQQQPVHPAQPSLEFMYIWQNLDNLFKQLDQNDVNDLNLKFMTMACEKINAKK